MDLSRLYRRIPIRCLVFIFILWNNSSYSPPVKNVGFYLNDESLKQPYTGDSVHFVLLLTSLLGLFPLIVYLTEYYGRKLSSDVFPSKTFQLLLRFYYSGFLFTLGFVEVLKRCFTELRPHFLTSCVPDVKDAKNPDEFITNFTCTGMRQDTLLGKDLYKSFPSGHSALSVYSFVFFNIYLYQRLSSVSDVKKYTWLLRSITVLSFAWAFTCCSTRILDNRHFWWDVLVGIIIGIVAAMMSIKALFKKITALPKERS